MSPKLFLENIIQIIKYHRKLETSNPKIPVRGPATFREECVTSCEKNFEIFFNNTNVQILFIIIKKIIENVFKLYKDNSKVIFFQSFLIHNVKVYLFMVLQPFF